VKKAMAREDKNLTRAMALLALAQDGRGAGAACPSPEDIAAAAEGLLPWERRHPVMRHLTACPECYRIWLEVARATGGPPLVSRRRSWPVRTLFYIGGVLAVVACLTVFWHWHRPAEESVSQPQFPPPPIISDQLGEKPPSAGTEPYSLPAVEGDGDAVTASDEAKSDALPSDADKQQAAASAGKDKTPASAAADKGKTEAAAKPATKPVAKPATKPPSAAGQNASIRVGLVQMRRSELTAWYGDLREMCRLTKFFPDQWNLLHARGTDILNALSESGPEEEVDRLWLILGQMEGLTLERRKNFCAWSNRELARQQKKQGSGK